MKNYFALMENIDLIQVNFSPDQLFLLNICLAFIMFGVSLDIKLSDFKYLVNHPKAVIVGLSSQLILLPLLTYVLILAFDPAPSVALGMILIGVCPGGNVSNFAVHLARANVALSVSLTSFVTMGAILLTPISFGFWAAYLPGTEALSQKIYVSPMKMAHIIIYLIAIPLFIGMWASHKFPDFIARLKKPIRTLSLLIFLAFVVFAIIGNYDNIINHLGKVFFLVFVHNILALIMGYSFARLNQLPSRDAQAISIETGIQNSGLALILIFNFFDGLGGMAMIAAWWGIWHLISGFSLATWWSYRNPPEEVPVREKVK
ncbi:MAG: bile acid:sodium symporter family protein [Bacteroidota bacterium]